DGIRDRNVTGVQTCALPIWKYQPSGNLGYARNYIKHIMPHLTPVGGVREIMPDVDWSEPLGDRASAISRYDQPVENYVFYAQNRSEERRVGQESRGQSGRTQ